MVVRVCVHMRMHICIHMYVCTYIYLGVNPLSLSSMLQWVAACCNVLTCVAVTLGRVAEHIKCVIVCVCAHMRAHICIHMYVCMYTP